MKSKGGMVIECQECWIEAGTVAEVELTDRPGIFKNVCTPTNMPTVCEKCGGSLVRRNL
jgi:hypothetical protein